MDSIPQDPDYHQFADTRWFIGVPNFNDVVSNIGFAIAGITGVGIIFWGNNEHRKHGKRNSKAAGPYSNP